MVSYESVGGVESWADYWHGCGVMEESKGDEADPSRYSHRSSEANMSDQEKPLQALAPATNDPTDPSFVAISPPTSPSSSSPPSRSTSPRLKRSKQWSLLPSLVVLLPILAFLARTSWNSHYTLPEPNSALFDANGTAIFSEAKAMEYITDLAAYADGTPRYRIGASSPTFFSFPPLTLLMF